MGGQLPHRGSHGKKEWLGVLINTFLKRHSILVNCLPGEAHLKLKLWGNCFQLGAQLCKLKFCGGPVSLKVLKGVGHFSLARCSALTNLGLALLSCSGIASKLQIFAWLRINK